MRYETERDHQIARQYMIRQPDEDLKDPVALGRYAALTRISPEAFQSRFQHLGSNVGGTQSKGCTT